MFKVVFAFFDNFLQPQHLCLQVHSLRAAESGECFWANVAHGRLLWGPVHIIRPGGKWHDIVAFYRFVEGGEVNRTKHRREGGPYVKGFP